MQRCIDLLISAIALPHTLNMHPHPYKHEQPINHKERREGDRVVTATESHALIRLSQFHLSQFRYFQKYHQKASPMRGWDNHVENHSLDSFRRAKDMNEMISYMLQLSNKARNHVSAQP